MTASSSGWLLVTLLLLAPRLAHADTGASPPTEEQVEAARVLYHDARELRRQGRLHEAVARALQAVGVAATPVTALEAGQLLVESGRLVEAREMARGVADMPVSPRESDKGRDARQAAAALAAQLDMRIPKIAVAARPAGVTLSLDGKTLAPTDPTAWLGVDPGPHALVVRVDERPCTTVNLFLSEGEERTIELRDAASTCRPEPPRPEAPRTPPSPLPTAPPVLPLPPPPAPAAPGAVASGSSGWRWAGVATAGGGGVALVVGAAIALHAKSDYDAVTSECPARGCSQAGFDARNDARSQAGVATGVMVVGGIAVAGGLALWWLAPSGTARVGAVVGPGSVGVAGVF
jgi:hypothetical protein